MTLDLSIGSYLSSELQRDGVSGHARRVLSDGINLGADTETGKDLWIPDFYRSRHMLFVGRSGSGKTGALASIAFQDIARGYPFILLDPMRSLYEMILGFAGQLNERMSLLARTPYPRLNSKIRAIRDELLGKFDFLDFEDRDCNGFRYNPLECDGLSPAECAGVFLRSYERSTQSDLNEQMRRSLILRSACSLIASANGTLLDVPTLLSMDSDDIICFIERLANKTEAEGGRIELSYIREYVQKFLCETSGKERRDLVASTWTALTMFLADEKVRKWVGSPKGNLKIDSAVNEGRYLVVNLPRNDLKSQKVLGSIILDRAQVAFERRNHEQCKKPVSLIIDEWHIFIGIEFAQTIATIRNRGCNLVLSGQHFSQMLAQDGGTQILDAVTANTSVHVYFTLDARDAYEQVVHRIFHPKGFMRKPEVEEISRSASVSHGRGKSRSVTKTVSESFGESEGVTVSLGNGMQVSFSESEGVSRAFVKSLGLTVSQGSSRSHCVSKSHGVSVTRTDSETIVEGSGTAEGTSHGEGSSESQGSGTSLSSGHSAGEGMSFSFSDGQSLSGSGVGAALAGMNASTHENSGHGMSSSSSSNLGNSDSTFSSVGRNLTNAVSSVISGTRSLAKGRSKSVGASKSTSKSVSEGTSESEALSRSVSQGLSFIEGFCRTAGKSISESIAESRSKSHTVGFSESHGTSESEQEGHTEGETRTRRAPYMSVDDEARVRSYELAELPPRHAYVFTREDGKVTRIVTHDIPFEFDNHLGGVDYTARFLESVRPAPVEIPEKNVFERLEAEGRKDKRASLKAPEGM
ncbi:MAG: hypothetical protein PHU25_01255 [Deltaproteobacteria bacterium]|nr:hypothetical protein [Deltaproteobacteria bacterium]